MLAGLSWVWLTAYDWRACARAIARVWNQGEEHIVAWDLGGLTWGGGDFTPPTPGAFADAVVRAIGGTRPPPGLTLRYVLGDFYEPGRGSADLETAERNAVTHLAKRKNVIMTMDSDEQAVNLPEFIAWLGPGKGARPRRCMTGTALAVYKVVGDVALVIGPWMETPVAMSAPGLFTGPRVPAQPVVRSPLRFINWFLATDQGENRPDAEVRSKLLAMDHMYEDRARVFDEWQATTLENAHAFKGIGGNYPRATLRPISLDDLTAGRWEALK